MSTTSTQRRNRTTASSHARDLTDLYLLCVHESVEVCSNCHERIRDREEHDTNTLGTGNRPEATLERAGAGVLGYDVRIRDEYGAIRDYVPRTFCGSCGRPDGLARDDSPSKREMLEAVPALVRRFEELGIPINADALERAVGHLRSDPDHHGSETEIWRAAVAVAVKHARPRDCVRCTY